MTEDEIRFIDLFGGIGGFRMGLEKASPRFECVDYIEFDEYAVESYNAIFDEDHEPRNVRNLDAEEIPDHDVLCGGFPCFPQGTKVLTSSGFKPIEEVEEGEKVMTHDREFGEVEETMNREYTGEVVRIEMPFGFEEIVATEEHPFYTLDVEKRYDERSGQMKMLSDGKEWVNASDLDETTYLGIPIPSEREIPESTYEFGQNGDTYETREHPTEDKNFWWCIGYYIAEGWYEKKQTRNGSDSPSQRVKVAASDDIKGKVADKFETVFGHSVISEERTTNKIHIISKALHSYVEDLGDSAHEKKLPEEVFFLPEEYQDALIDGLMDGDGHYGDGTMNYVSTSEELIRQIQYLFTTRYGKPASVVKVETSDTTEIEGRTVNQRDYYRLQFNPGGRRVKNKREDDIVWVKPDSVETYERKEPLTVYNLEVEGQETYTADRFIAHNCQSFSQAGNRGGLDDTRGTLFFQIARIAKEKRPKILFLENVRGLLSHEEGKTFKILLQTLNEIGYYVDYRLLNSKNFGVPQNRRRVYITAYDIKWISRRLQEDTRNGANEESSLSEGIIKSYLLEALLKSLEEPKEVSDVRLREWGLDYLLLKEFKAMVGADEIYGQNGKFDFLREIFPKRLVERLEPKSEGQQTQLPVGGSDSSTSSESESTDENDSSMRADTTVSITEMEVDDSIINWLREICSEENSKKENKPATPIRTEPITEKETYTSAEIGVIVSGFAIRQRDSLADWLERALSNLTKMRANTDYEERRTTEGSKGTHHSRSDYHTMELGERKIGTGFELTGSSGGESGRQVFPLGGEDRGDSGQDGQEDNLATVHPNRPELGQADRVYRSDGLLPALNSGWTPQVEAEALNSTPDGEIKTINPEAHQDYRFYDTDGISPCLASNRGGGSAKHPYITTEALNSTIEGNSYCIDSSYWKGTSPGDIGSGRRAQIIEHRGHKDKQAKTFDISPTLRSDSHGHQPKVLDDTFGYDEIREYTEFVPNLRSERNGLMLFGGGSAEQTTLTEKADSRGKIRVHRDDEKKSEIQGYSAFLPSADYVDVVDNHDKNLIQPVNESPSMIKKVGDYGEDNFSIAKEAFCIPANPMSDRVQMVSDPQPILTPNRLNKDQNGRRVKGASEEMFTLTGQDIHGVVIDDMWQDGIREYTDYSPSVTAHETGGWEDIKTFGSDKKKIRKLTPRECWRLQGFPDWAFDSAQQENSNTQLYKQAGNAVTVNVIEALGEELVGCFTENQQTQE